MQKGNEMMTREQFQDVLDLASDHYLLSGLEKAWTYYKKLTAPPPDSVEARMMMVYGIDNRYHPKGNFRVANCTILGDAEALSSATTSLLRECALLPSHSCVATVYIPRIQTPEVRGEVEASK